MHEVKIPDSIKVGGFDYSIKLGKEANRELESAGWRGSHAELVRRIEVRDDLLEQDVSCTFIHECFHAIDNVYCHSHLDEADIKGISHGFFQVLEQLGVRFIK